MRGWPKISAWGPPLVMPSTAVFLLILFIGRWGVLESWFPPRSGESLAASTIQMPQNAAVEPPAEQPSPPTPSPAPQRPSLDAVMSQPILEVGSSIVSVDYYLKRLRLRHAELRAQGRSFNGGTEPFQMLQNLSLEALLRQGQVQFGLQVSSEAIDKDILVRFSASEKAESMTSEMEERFQEQLKGSGLTEQEYRQTVETQLLEAELDRYLREHMAGANTHVEIQVILLLQEEEAQKVLGRIQAGEDFTELATKLSRDPDSGVKGGHMGWVPQGLFDPAFDEMAFNLPPGGVGGPVTTPDGYYLIRVLGKQDDYPVSPQNLSLLRANALEYWLKRERRQTRIRYHFDSTKYDFVLGHLTDRGSSP